jgi:hypothetical protein
MFAAKIANFIPNEFFSANDDFLFKAAELFC